MERNETIHWVQIWMCPKRETTDMKKSFKSARSDKKN